MTHNYVWNFTGGNFPLNSLHYPETAWDRKRWGAMGGGKKDKKGRCKEGSAKEHHMGKIS